MSVHFQGFFLLFYFIVFTFTYMCTVSYLLSRLLSSESKKFEKSTITRILVHKNDKEESGRACYGKNSL
jgi:hypothetical protein